MTTAWLNRIATSVPAHDVHAAFLSFARTLLPDPRQEPLFRRMAGRSGIAHRFSPLRPAADPAGGSVDAEGFYQRGRFPTSGARMARYEREALPLALRAVAGLDLGEETRRITHVVVASCTGFYAPGLDLELIEALGLPRSAERTTVGFMGCCAAFNALKLARHIVRSEPGARVLLVSLELSTLHLQETGSLDELLSFLIFGDGCAACLISAEPGGLALDRFHSTVLPESADLLSWRVGDQGFDMVLSGRVPGAVREAVSGASAEILDGAAPGAMDLWAVHPGGRSVLDAVEGALALGRGALEASRGVLADHGNMSSATVLFVMERLLRQGARGRGCAMGFGPGLVAESLLFRAAA